MKQTIACFLLLAICSLPLFSSAQTVKEIFQHNWSGSSVQDGGTLTKDGKIYISQKLKITINADNTLTGKNTAIFTLDGISYTRVTAIKGNFYPDDQRIFITDDYELSAEKLPYGLYWCGTQGYLKVYKNANKPGYYLLKGSMKGYTAGCDFTSDLELKDNPY